MSVDIHPYALKWKPFLAANENADNTLQLFMRLANNDEAERRPASFREPFRLAEDAAELYEGVRGTLPDREREKWDQFLYASWWEPEEHVVSQSPLLQSLPRHSISLKGPLSDCLIRTLAPETVEHVASVWRSINQDVLLHALRDQYDQEVLQNHNYESAEAVCEYLASWGEAFLLTAKDRYGLVVQIS